MECVFSNSYGIGLDRYDWQDLYRPLKQEGEIGVNPYSVVELINSSKNFTSSPITDINSIALALKNDQRVLVGFNYNDRSGNSFGHAVMVKKSSNMEQW